MLTVWRAIHNRVNIYLEDSTKLVYCDITRYFSSSVNRDWLFQISLILDKLRHVTGVSSTYYRFCAEIIPDVDTSKSVVQFYCNSGE